MKALNKLFIAAIAAISMTACNNELGEQQANNSGIINFRMGIGASTSSRIAMDDDKYSATFAKGDEVGIFVKDKDSYTNIKYSTEDGTNWTGGPIKAPADETYSYTFYAYYPYNESNTDASSITTTVKTDQETNGYIKNDFLISTATTSNTTVNLPFDHALSLVEVKLAGDGAAEGATVSILDVATDATIDLTTSTVTTGTTKANVTMDALTGVAMKYRAIVPEQKISANTSIFKIVSGGITYEASFNNDITFEKGQYLAMIITLDQDGTTAEIEITTGATINDWTEGEGGDTTSGVTTLLDLSTLINSEMNFVEKSSWTNDKLTDKEDYWFTRTSTTTTVSFDTAENAIKAANTTDRGAWGTTSFGYHCGTKVFEKTTYRLTFDAKSTIVGNQVFAVGVRNSDDTKGFRVSNLNNGKRNMIAVNYTEDEVQTGYKTITVDIDFTKANTTTNLNDQEKFEETVDSDLNGITILLFNNLNQPAESAQKFNTYFKNIKIEKVVE